MKIKLDKGAYKPTKAHGGDVGFDLYAMEGQVVPAKESAIFDTGVHVQLPKCVAGVLMSKSGLYHNHDIISTGLVDPGYTGKIKVKLCNLGGYDYKVEAGDKITQLCLFPFIEEELEEVEDIEGGERGDNGFGSSGR